MQKTYTVGEGDYRTEVTVSVNKNMMFIATHEGFEFKGERPSDVLNSVEHFLKAFAEGNVPALNIQGQAIILRGIHKTTGDVLVTRNGSKESLSHYRDVYTVHAQSTLARWLAKQAEVDAITLEARKIKDELDQYKITINRRDPVNPFVVPEGTQTP